MNAPLKKPPGGNNAPLKKPAAPAGPAPSGGGAPADDFELPEPETDDALPPASGAGKGGASGGGGPTSASTNFPPVGDIQVKKKSGTFNTYNLQLSYGQIEVLRQALEKDHANPVADELLQMFNYYLSTVPGPGEEEEDVKAREEASAVGQKPGAEEGDDEMGLPMPPGEPQEQGTTTVGEGPDDMGGGDDDLEADPRFQDAPDASGGGEGGIPPGFEQETDERLPEPPRE